MAKKGAILAAFGYRAHGATMPWSGFAGKVLRWLHRHGAVQPRVAGPLELAHAAGPMEAVERSADHLSNPIFFSHSE